MRTRLLTQMKVVPRSFFTPVQTGQMQRKCACGTHTTGGGECEECSKQTLQRAARNSGPDTRNSDGVPSIVHEVLRSSGQPLDMATRAFMEPRFGHDFSQVRLHTDARAADSAQAVNALAYTVGPDVVFGTDRYAPQTTEGRSLLTHELTHVIQQQEGRAGGVQTQPTEGTGIGAQEEEAERAAQKVLEKDDAPAPETPQPAKTEKNKITSCDRTILAEGTCQDLVAGSKWICCDPENGFKREGKTKDVDGKDCPSSKFTPIFTCDNNCKTALQKGCDDSDNWMAIPAKGFTKAQCGDVYTICANGNKTTGYVRDRSERQTPFEVSPGIQKALGVPVGSSFKGAIYRPGADVKKIDADACCKS